MDVRASWRGLGLHLPGPSGSVMMAFVIPSTGHTAAAGDITVQMSTDPLSNPNCVQTPTLRFSGTGERGRQFAIDLSSRLTVDSPARALRALVNRA